MYSFVYPGQGSQAPGMGRFLFENFTLARQIFEEASDALSIDMKKLCFEGSESDLALTHNTQPALLTVSTATARVVQDLYSLKPSFHAGHSIGEYAALVLTDVIRFSDAIRAVRTRGEAMQSAVPVGLGGMAAVMGLTPEETNKLCLWAVNESKTSPLSPANFNSPGQIVISGNQETISWLRTNLNVESIFPGESKRVKLIPLQVSAPFHCSMMAPAEERMKTFLHEIEFKNASVPVVQNFTAKPETKANVLRENLIRQVSAPVLWMQSVSEMQKSGVETYFECGHSKVLNGLIKKIDANARVLNLNSLDDLKLIETTEGLL